MPRRAAVRYALPPVPQPLDQLPQSIRTRGTTTWLAGQRVPALLVHPHWDEQLQRATRPAPVLIWMHGRTVNKELDPGRYLTLARAGIASCALDLPGHGQRSQPELQAPEQTLRVVAQMVDELDAVVDDLRALPDFAGPNIALGGMSAGGMAALVRLTRLHPFAAALVECTTGSWRWQHGRAMFHPDLVEAMDPIRHLEGWREIPILGLHNQLDQWVPIEGQREFFKALQERARHPDYVVLHEFPETGAPFEHSGFGRLGRQAKEMGSAFLARVL